MPGVNAVCYIGRGGTVVGRTGSLVTKLDDVVHVQKVSGIAEVVVSGAKRIVPEVTDPKLKNLVRDLYKGALSPKPIRTGSTADAVRNELLTGRATHGRFHFDKAQYVNALTKWLRKTPDACHRDRLVAQSLLDDLNSALGKN